jgi:uncharacterized membrane protein
LSLVPGLAYLIPRISRGEPLGKGNPQVEPELGENEVAVWPIRQDGGTATWGAIVPTAREILADGYMRVGDYDERTRRWSLGAPRVEGIEGIVALAAAAATLFIAGCASHGSAPAQTADSSVKVKCYGANACKGQAQCKTSMNSCKGHNSCKGQGFVTMGEKACLERFGRS